MVDVILVRSNSVIYDPRVHKIVGSLHKKYSVLVLGWNRDGISKEKMEDYDVGIELLNIKTSFWKPSLLRMFFRLCVYFPLFWIWVFVRLIVHSPEIVHACDLDTIFPCYIYKILFKKKLIFDIFDRYAMAFIPMKFKRFYSIVNYYEELFCKLSDALVVAGGEKVFSTVQTRQKKSAIILNCPEDFHLKRSGLQERRSCENLTLVYTGLVRNNRSLESVASAVNNIEGVQFIIAGMIMDKDLLTELLTVPNVKYQGLLTPVGAVQLEASSDVMIALYNPKDPQNIFVIPNKTLEAMMCGIPVITNIAEHLIKEVDCGILVEYDNIDQIRSAIISLRDNPDLRKTLGNNGRKAFLEKYNWNIMEQKLYEIYDWLLPK